MLIWLDQNQTSLECLKDASKLRIATLEKHVVCMLNYNIEISICSKYEIILDDYHLLFVKILFQRSKLTDLVAARLDNN